MQVINQSGRSIKKGETTQFLNALFDLLWVGYDWLKY